MSTRRGPSAAGAHAPVRQPDRWRQVDGTHVSREERPRGRRCRSHLRRCRHQRDEQRRVRAAHTAALRAQSRRERGLPYNMRPVTQRTYTGTRSQARCGTRGRSLPQVCGVRRGGAQGAASVASPCGLGPGRLGPRNAGAGEASRQRPRLLCCIAPLSEGRFCTGAYMIGSALGCRMAACARPKQVPLQ